MNERVWLQSSVTFVNTKLAISLGFLATFLTFSCSPAENSEEIAPVQPNIETETPQNTLPTLPIIWESKPAAAPIIDIAIGKSESGAFYTTAILEDGSAQTFDMDGIPVARSKPDLFAEISSSKPISVSGTDLIAHIAKSQDDLLSLALVSPENKIVGFSALNTSPTIDTLCEAKSDQPMDEMQINYESDDAIFKAAIDLSTDTPVLAAAQTPNSSETDIICGPTQTLSTSAQSLERKALAISKQSQSTLLVTDIQNGSRQTYSLKEGMSVDAPQALSSIATYPDFISIDYPQGLLVVAGEHNDGTSKLSYISMETLLDDFSDDADTPQEEDATNTISPEIKALQDALKAVSEEN